MSKSLNADCQRLSNSVGFVIILFKQSNTKTQVWFYMRRLILSSNDVFLMFKGEGPFRNSC